MIAPATRLATVAFGLAIGSAGAVVLTSGIDPAVVALAATVAALAIGNAMAWGPGSRWVLVALTGASAMLLVGLAVDVLAGPTAVLLAAALPPAVVLMRLRLADATDAAFVPIAAHDASIAIGAAAVVTALAFDTPGWIPPALAAVTLGFVAGVVAATDQRDGRGGHESTAVGWGRWATVTWGAIGIAIGISVPAILTMQDERWAINLQGRAMTVAGGLAIGAIALAVGHWYHTLETAEPERRANSAGVATAVAGGLFIAAAYSTTLIGIVTVLMAAIAVIVFVTSLLDVLMWSGRPSSTRLAAIGLATASVIVGYAAGFVITGGLDTWTPRSLAVLGALPLIASGLWGLRRTSGAERTGTRSPAQTVAASAFLEVSGLEAGYGRLTVLHGIDLTVESGDVLAVMGMNGVGKTTLLRTLAGLLSPSHGAIVLGGADVTDFPAAWRTELGICHIAGSESVVPELTVDDNLAMFAHGSRLDQSEFARRRSDAVATFPVLDERSGQRAESLSGGERQMLALAKAMIQRPRLLLIDEFSLGLAPSVVEDLIPTIRALTAGGTPTILVEQSVDTALALATQVVVLDKGRVTWRGSAERLAANGELIAELFLPPVGAELT